MNTNLSFTFFTWNNLITLCAYWWCPTRWQKYENLSMNYRCTCRGCSKGFSMLHAFTSRLTRLFIHNHCLIIDWKRLVAATLYRIHRMRWVFVILFNSNECFRRILEWHTPLNCWDGGWTNSAIWKKIYHGYHGIEYLDNNLISCARLHASPYGQYIMACNLSMNIQCFKCIVFLVLHVSYQFIITVSLTISLWLFVKGSCVLSFFEYFIRDKLTFHLHSQLPKKSNNTF